MLGKDKRVQYIPKDELRALSRRSDLMGVWVTLHCWGVILLAAAIFIVWPNPVTFLLAVLIIGGRQLGLAILMHDAAHGILFKNQNINNFVGQFFLAYPVGADMPGYRKYHLRHHLNTQQDNDPDLQLSAPFPITRASFVRKAFRDLTGITALKLRIGQILGILRKTKTPHTGSDQAFNVKSVIGPYAVNLILFGLCWLAAGYWWAYFVLWFLPLFSVFQLVLRVRNIAEHAMTSHDTDPRTHARTTRANIFERMLVAPYWVNYHIEHHAFMHVPCWQLPALHAAMLREGHEKNMEIRNSYADVLRIATSGGIVDC